MAKKSAAGMEWEESILDLFLLLPFASADADPWLKPTRRQRAKETD